ncbi:MAG: DUF3017 domain-containing protein [Candidatus Nanopelagicales bacterium]|nr:DUF3017 domain-containing protein [Candidatus Nanopelagicales bacterium]
MTGVGGSEPAPDVFNGEFGHTPDSQFRRPSGSEVPAQRLPANVVPLWPDDEWRAPVTPIPLPAQLPAQRTASAPSGRATNRLAEWPILLVGTGVLVALVLSATVSLRIGCVALGAAMSLATVLRIVLGERHIGMLRSRSRLTDLLVMGFFSVSMLALALSVPAPG